MIEVRAEELNRPLLDPLGQAQFALWRGGERLATFGLMGQSLFAPSLWLWAEVEAVPRFSDLRQVRQVLPAVAAYCAIDNLLAEVDNERNAKFLRYLGFKLIDDTGLLPIYEWRV